MSTPAPPAMTASTFAAALADHFLATLPDDRPLERVALERPVVR
ncbi:MAG: hypothetical protein AAFV01_10605 [Bacteroidota bacterium]